MKGSDVFPSNYLKTTDLQGHKVRVIMAGVEMEKLGDEEKPVLYFHGKEKGLVLNKTKWNAIGDLYGDDSDDWEGKAITLAPGKTSYQGKRVDCIDIYPPEAVKTAAPKPKIDPQAPIPSVKDELDDAIPF